MGLLDNFNFDDPKNQGLLAAAAQMLQQSGPSRMPVGLGQIMGGGLSAFNGGMQAAQQRKLEEQQQQQMAQMRGLQIQEAQGGLQDHALARQQAQKMAQLQQEYASRPGGAAPAMPDMSRMQGGPTLDNAAALAQQQAPSASGAPKSQYEQAMDYAQFLQSKGMVHQAMSVAKEAQVLKPKFATEFRQAMGPDGKLHNYQVAEDGQIKEVALGVKPEMVEVGLGDRKQFVDKNSLTSGQSFTMGQSPDSVASNAVTMRGQNMTNARALDQLNAPQFNQEAGGFVSRPTAAAPGGSFMPLADYQKRDKPLTEFQGKASLFASRMDKANKTMDELAAAGTNKPSVIKSTLESVPLIGGGLGAAGNFIASAPQQRLEQSQRDFVNAVLRQESGAAISAGEFDSAKKQYFPQPGDSEGVIAQKAANRATAIQGMALQSGPGAAKLGVGDQGAVQPVRKSAIKGQVLDGYRFKGGNPADQNSWEKI